MRKSLQTFSSLELTAILTPPHRINQSTAAPKARTTVTVKAASQTEDLNKKLSEVTSTVSEKWDETEEKPAVVTLGVFGYVPPYYPLRTPNSSIHQYPNPR